MKTNRKISLIYVCTAFAVIFAAAGCNAERKSGVFPVSEVAAVPKNTAAVPKWQESERKAALVLGEGYTESPFAEKLLDFLSDEFGLAEDGGLVLPLMYPEMFVAGSGRLPIRLLPDLLADWNIRALIFIGAPEKTHEVLAGLKSSGADYPIFSFFPQDDVLGTEWASSLVFDGDPSFFALSEDDGILFLDEIPPLVKTVLGSLDIYDEKSFAAAARIELADLFVPDGWMLTPYIDPETSLKAENHFILTKLNSDMDEL